MKLKTMTFRAAAALTIFVLLLAASPAYADDTGLLPPTNNTGTGGGWSNTGNAYASDVRCNNFRYNKA